MDSYLDLGYDNLLSKTEDIDLSNGINEGNEDAIVSDATISWGKVAYGDNAPEDGATNNSSEIVDGVLITDVINESLDTQSRNILEDFDFGSTDYAGAVRSGDVVWNTGTGVVTSGSGVVLYRDGLVGVDNGDITFSIDATTGDATFSGTLVAASGTFGTITSGTLDGLTITGGLIQTDSDSDTGVKINNDGDYIQIYDGSEERMRLDGNSLEFFNSLGNNVGNIYTDSTTSLYLEAPTGNDLVLETESTSYSIIFYSGSNLKAYINNSGLTVNDTIYCENLDVEFDIDCDDIDCDDITCDDLDADLIDCTEVQTDVWRAATDSGKYFQYSGSNFECNDDLYVGGTLSKAAGSFRIDHPNKPDTHYLQHSFVESPEMLNIYTGQGLLENNVCKIKMPDWFIALNGDNKSTFTYQLTPKRKNSLWVREEMNKEGEVVFGSEHDGNFYYMITAIRHDDYAINNPINVELKK